MTAAIAATAFFQCGLDANKKKRKGFLLSGKSDLHIEIAIGESNFIILAETSYLSYSGAYCMRILGIETSCDETAVCLIDASGQGVEFRYEILGNALLSQASLHAQYGGVFPNLAKREHSKNLVPLLQECLRQSSALKESESPDAIIIDSHVEKLLEREPELLATLREYVKTYSKPALDAIAVTAGPGLEPALWVGINFAKSLSYIWNVPIVAVNHMEGHVVMPMMLDGKMREFNFPTLSLLISGGHTELVLSDKFGSYRRVGETRDDAAGEAFDKVARLMDLPYPGGPEISRLAKEARDTGIKGEFTFTRPMMKENSYDFSFSGLKTAVRNLVEKSKPLSDDMKKMIAREFEDTVADVLIEKTMRAADEYAAQTLIVGGGVSANARIREMLAERASTHGIRSVLVPPPDLATDNAIMIALAGYFLAMKKEFVDADSLAASGNLRLERD